MQSFMENIFKHVNYRHRRFFLGIYKLGNSKETKKNTSDFLYNNFLNFSNEVSSRRKPFKKHVLLYDSKWSLFGF